MKKNKNNEFRLYEPPKVFNGSRTEIIYLLDKFKREYPETDDISCLIGEYLEENHLLEEKDDKAEDGVERSIVNLMLDGKRWKLAGLQNKINEGLHPDDGILKPRMIRKLNNLIKKKQVKKTKSLGFYEIIPSRQEIFPSFIYHTTQSNGDIEEDEG